MSNKQLLIETINFTPIVLTEEKRANGYKALVFEGVFGRADVVNKNNRLYTLEEMAREVTKLQPAVSARRLMGELDHPEDLTVRLQNVSHLITELRMHEDTVLGKGEVLPTEKGAILRGLLEARVTIGLSSRGAGELVSMIGESDDAQQVVDFTLETYDAVAEASAPGAEITNLVENIRKRQNRYTNSNILSPDDFMRAVDSVVEDIVKYW